MTQRNSRRWLYFGVFLIVLTGVYFAACALVAEVIGRRLQEMVGTNLNAALTIGRVRYHFPYGVTVTDASNMIFG